MALSWILAGFKPFDSTPVIRAMRIVGFACNLKAENRAWGLAADGCHPYPPPTVPRVRHIACASELAVVIEGRCLTSTAAISHLAANPSGRLTPSMRHLPNREVVVVGQSGETGTESAGEYYARFPSVTFAAACSVGAAAHSGGLDDQGCHGGSRAPY